MIIYTNSCNNDGPINLRAHPHLIKQSNIGSYCFCIYAPLVTCSAVCYIVHNIYGRFKGCVFSAYFPIIDFDIY